MIERNEVLLRRDNQWLHFRNPHCVLRTARVEEVHDLLEEVERLVNGNHWHAAGFVSYEAAPAFDRALQVIDAREFPLLWFGLYQDPRIVTTSEIFYNQLKSREFQKDFRSLEAPDWRAAVEREDYDAAIKRIKDYIARGRTYQVNYTVRLNAGFAGSEWDFFLKLVQSQNKYAAYLDLGDYVICSASPELFFELDGETIRSRPMKGTIERGLTTSDDEAQAKRLQKSIKNRAENVMIVDMVRNDLGRIARIGSVQVSDLFAIEKYPTLLQMTSTVQARTTASLTDIFGALFPSASITGAPKVSTMKIISELETSPRRIYTGSIGYISPQRRAQFNVAIRTVLIDRQTNAAEYGIGGGIISDSTDTDEYSEALLKSHVLTQAPTQFSLIETILWTPGEGYFLLEKHIARMQDSAGYFDFTFSKKQIAAYVDAISVGFRDSQRLRLLLHRSGDLSSEAKLFQPHSTSFKACLAKRPIDSRNVFLYHKTTRREAYEEVHTVPQIYNDVLLYNEKDELTEFTIGNLVIELDGELVTPPIACGLLPGTFRAQLLETGKIKELIVHRKDLDRCSKIFMVNSVRKWVEVTLIK